MDQTTSHPKAFAAALVAVIAGLIAVSIAAFNGDFRNTDEIHVISQRSGLLLTAGSKVKFRGVEIGRVTSVEPTGNMVQVNVAVDSGRLHSIPGNTRVAITSTTVFGAKFVSFEDPPHADGTSLRPGATVNANDVTVEINSVFQELTDVLQQIEPTKLNVTLSALADALGDGRGDQLGTALDSTADLIGRLHSSLPALGNDVELGSQAITAYAPATPALMSTLSRLSITAKSLTDEQRNFNLMLTNVTGFANAGAQFLNTNTPSMIDAFRLLRPSTQLLKVYSPEYSCLIKGMDTLLQNGLPALGGKDPGIRLSISFIQGIPLYGYPGNLPKVNATGGPHCMGLPDIPMGTRATFLVTDTGVNPYRTDPAQAQWNSNDLMTLLLGTPQGAHP